MGTDAEAHGKKLLDESRLSDAVEPNSKCQVANFVEIIVSPFPLFPRLQNHPCSFASHVRTARNVLHTATGNVAHGHGQRCARPRTTLHTAVCNAPQAFLQRDNAFQKRSGMWQMRT